MTAITLFPEETVFSRLQNRQNIFPSTALSLRAPECVHAITSVNATKRSANCTFPEAIHTCFCQSVGYPSLFLFKSTAEGASIHNKLQLLWAAESIMDGDIQRRGCDIAAGTLKKVKSYGLYFKGLFILDMTHTKMFFFFYAFKCTFG